MCFWEYIRQEQTELHKIKQENSINKNWKQNKFNKYNKYNHKYPKFVKKQENVAHVMSKDDEQLLNKIMEHDHPNNNTNASNNIVIKQENDLNSNEINSMNSIWPKSPSPPAILLTVE